MAEKGTGDNPEPTLELPSLRPSFRRKKRPDPAAPEDASPSPQPPAASGGGHEMAPAAEPVVTAPVTTDATTPDDVEPDTGDSPAIPGRRRERGGPLLPALTAVVLTGLLVGLVGAGATFGGLQACEVASGTSSCGGPGLFILVAIVIAMMLLGAVLLRLLDVSESRGVSFFGVGLLCVIVLLGLTEALFSAWMFVVVPALTALTFAIGRWVTTRFVDPAEDEPGYDVR